MSFDINSAIEVNQDSQNDQSTVGNAGNFDVNTAMEADHGKGDKTPYEAFSEHKDILPQENNNNAYTGTNNSNKDQSKNDFDKLNDTAATLQGLNPPLPEGKKQLQPSEVKKMAEYPDHGFLNSAVIQGLGTVYETFDKPLGIKSDAGEAILEQEKQKHPIAVIIAGTAPFLLTAPLFPGGLIGLSANFGTVSGLNQLGHERINESLMKPESTKALDIALETAKGASLGPIWHYSEGLQFVGRPIASALTKAGVRGAGTASLDMVYGSDITQAFKDGGVMTALSLMFESPTLAKTVIGRGITARANAIYTDMASKAGLPEIKIDPDSPQVQKQIFDVTTAMGEHIKGAKDPQIASAAIKLPDGNIVNGISHEAVAEKLNLADQGIKEYKSLPEITLNRGIDDRGSTNFIKNSSGKKVGDIYFKSETMADEGIDISIDEQRKGYGTSAIKKVFDTGIDTIHGDVGKQNLQAQKFWKSIGGKLNETSSDNLKLVLPKEDFLKATGKEGKYESGYTVLHPDGKTEFINKTEAMNGPYKDQLDYEGNIKGLPQSQFLQPPQAPEIVNPKTLQAIEEQKLIVDAHEGAYQKAINRFQSIENITKKAEAIGLKPLPGEDPGLSATRYLSVANQAEITLNKGTYKVNPDGSIQVTGEGLRPIINEFDLRFPKSEADLNDYLISKRTIEDLQRKATGEEENIASPEQVKEAQSKLEELNKKYGGDIVFFEETANRIYDYQRRLLDVLVDSGRMSTEVRDNILEQNRNYIPFDRVMEDTAKTKGFLSQLLGQKTKEILPKKNRFTKVGSPIKTIRGSEREIHDPIESIIKNTYKIADAAARNKVFKDIYALKDIEGLDIKSVKITDNPAEILRREQSVDNILGFVDGKLKILNVSDNLKQAMTGLNETSSSMLVKILSVPSNLLRTGATITPEFMLRNPIRDQWTAFLQTQVGFKPFIDTTRALSDVMGKTPVYDEWIRSGGSYAGFVELSRPSLGKMLAKLKGEEPLWNKLNIVSTAQEISQVMEQATRIAVFKAAKGKGQSSVEAAKESRESTLDFNRRGSQTKEINQMVAFFNAGIQGLDKQVRIAQKDPVGVTMKALTTITIPSLLLYMNNRQHEDYAELPRWQKDLFWMFKGGDQWYRIPKPFLFGQMFGSLPERFFEFMDTKDPASFDKFADSLYNSLSPVQGEAMSGLLPTALKPLIENTTNWSFFRERPLVSESKLRLLPPEQSNKYDTETAKALGKAFNVSPTKIENLITGYLGGSGRYALQGGDQLINAIKKMKGEDIGNKRPTDINDIPLIKGFTARNPVGNQSQSVQNFYENSDHVTKVHNSIKQLEKTGDHKGALELRDNNPEYVLYPQVNRISKHIKELEKEVDRVIASNISDQTKKLRIEDLEKERTELAKKFNQKIKSIKD